VLIGYGLLLTALAWLIEPYAPTRIGRARSDPGGLYPAMLVCLVAGPALLALSGALFPARAAVRVPAPAGRGAGPSPAPSRRRDAPGRRGSAGGRSRRPRVRRGPPGEPLALSSLLLSGTVIGALPGVAILLLLLVVAPLRPARRPAWPPPGAEVFAVAGLLGAGVALLVALFLVLAPRTDDPLVPPADVGRRVRGCLMVAAYFGGGGLVGTVLGGALPTAVGVLLGFGWLAGSGWFLLRRAYRGRE